MNKTSLLQNRLRHLQLHINKAELPGKTTIFEFPRLLLIEPLRQESFQIYCIECAVAEVETWQEKLSVGKATCPPNTCT